MSMIQSLPYIQIVPELFLLLIAVLLLMVGVFNKKRCLSLASLSRLAFFASVIVLIAITQLPREASILFNGMFVSNGFTYFMKFLIVVSAAVTFVLTMGLEKKPLVKTSPWPFEMPIIMLLSVVGMMVMVSAGDFIALYMGLELQSLCLYILAAIRREDARASEAGLKYFILGALSSGMLLYGISLVYGFSGTTNFAILSDIFSGDTTLSIGMLVGLVFVMVGLCFKVSAVPFHMWTPDVYQGSPTIVTTFFAAAPKVAALALFMRLLLDPFAEMVGQWQQIIIVVSALSMIVGALGALYQRNIKRLMAYSSIGHVGYALIGLASANYIGVRGMLIYLAIYITMTLGMFACILMMCRKNKGDVTPTAAEDIDDLAGLSETHPLRAFAISAFMLSMAGIPPLAGFFGKFYIFLAAIEAELYILAVLGVLSSVIAAFYYIRIIKLMYFDTATQAPLEKHGHFEMKLICSIAAIINLFLFTYLDPLIILASQAASTIGGLL